MTDLSIVAVIPLFNGARWIEEALRSVLSQTLQPDEIVVIDDGSTDDGAAIVKRLAQKLPIILLRKPNGGQSSARNFGIAHSKSALIALLDQDDVWYPHHLEMLIERFRRCTALGWSYSNMDLIDEQGDIIRFRHLDSLPMEHPKQHLERCLGEDMHIMPSASMMSRSAFDAVGGFDEQLSGYEDDDLFLRMFHAGYGNVFVNQALSQWRMSSTSCSHSLAMIRSAAVYMQKLIENFPDGKSWIVPRFYSHFWTFYGRSLLSGNPAARCLAVDGLKQTIPFLGRKGTLMKLALPMMR